MRIDLTTTYDERHAAKALGARWDGFKRVWYVIDPPDLSPFLRWIPSAINHRPESRPAKSNKAQYKSFGTTASVPVDHCGCNVLPWDHCEHTAPEHLRNVERELGPL